MTFGRREVLLVTVLLLTVDVGVAFAATDTHVHDTETVAPSVNANRNAVSNTLADQNDGDPTAEDVVRRATESLRGQRRCVTPTTSSTTDTPPLLLPEKYECKALSVFDT